MHAHVPCSAWDSGAGCTPSMHARCRHMAYIRWLACLDLGDGDPLLRVHLEDARDQVLALRRDIEVRREGVVRCAHASRSFSEVEGPAPTCIAQRRLLQCIPMLGPYSVPSLQPELPVFCALPHALRAGRGSSASKIATDTGQGILTGPSTVHQELRTVGSRKLA